MIELHALHKHWLVADSIKQFMLAPVPKDKRAAELPASLVELGQMLSASFRLSVFYALLYVVVEGYKQLGCQHTKIDALLARDDYVDALHRFRNATFHFQEDPLSPKLLAFLEPTDSENWIRQLHFAFKEFFETTLPIKETLEKFRDGA